MIGALYKKDGVQIMSTSNSFQTTIDWLKEEIPGKIEENNIPGLSITLVTKDEAVFSQGFGYTDQDEAQEVNEDTLLGLQSTSKTFTAIGFLYSRRRLKAVRMKMPQVCTGFQMRLSGNGRLVVENVNIRGVARNLMTSWQTTAIMSGPQRLSENTLMVPHRRA